MQVQFQSTLADRVELTGRGLHSGTPARIALVPAAPNTGIVFKLHGKKISVGPEAVRNTDFATVIGDTNGSKCSTVEHLMAALSGLGIDNAVIEVEGDEIPAFDGSSVQFVDAIDAVGTEQQDAPRRYIKVLKPIRVDSGNCSAELLPYDAGFRVEVEIDFDHAAIGRQRFAGMVTPDVFRDDLARARTFGFMRDVAKLWGAGLALGASLDNTICLADDRVVNPDGLRYADEFVRHKALDAVGDLAMAGLPLLGRYRSLCGGHKLNAAVVAALMADRSAWTIVEAEPTRKPRRGHAEIGAQVAPAYRADLS
ncbi:MAG: UDP-3-O-acyl-N-acetylglucosamine deacetylase [Xanthobacteraceae bacterium]|nr:UDP-3-O-acyl-N-acetylglucosamine deacetylase [Xanthobacteraceae bacterium]